MALSRAMKNLQHDAAQARRGGGNPKPTGGGMSGMISQAMQQARARQAGTAGAPSRPGPEAGAIRGTRGPRGPVMTPGGGKIRPPMGRGKPRRGMAQIAVPGGGMPRGGVMGGPAGGAGKPRPGAGTFGFASRGGGGTPALQQATAGAKMQAMRQRAAPRPGGLPGAMSGAQQQAAMQRARGAGPAALAKPRGQSVASRIGGQQGPPARRGGMARALGSGGSRRRMLR